MVAITNSSLTQSTNDRTDKAHLEVIFTENVHSSKSSDRKPSRKQWSFQDKPKSLLKRLRSQLAEDGDPDSQYLLAKTLLEEKNDIDYKENSQQAVFWLTQASLQGSLEATNLLKECMETGLGICDQNYLDVKNCIKMNHQEKLARTAAKKMFDSFAEGNDFVTRGRLESRISEIASRNVWDANPTNLEGSNNFDVLNKMGTKVSLEEKYSNLRLTESQITDAAVSVIEGNVPSIKLSRIVAFAKVNSSLNYKLDLLFQFIRSFITYFSMLNLKYSLVLGFACVSFFSIFEVLQVNGNLPSLLILLWVCSMFIMCLSICSILSLLLEESTFECWISVFKHFSEALDSHKALNLYKRSYVKYGLSYSIAVCVYLILPNIYPLILSFVLPLQIFFSSLLFLIVFSINFSYSVISSSLYILAHCSDSQFYFNYYLGSILPSVDIFSFRESFVFLDSLEVSLNLQSIFHILWLASLLITYLNLGLFSIFLHIICISWFHITLNTISSCSFMWISWSCAFWVIVIVLPVCCRFISFIIPVTTLCFSSLLADFDISSTVILCVSVAIILLIVTYFEAKIGLFMKLLVFILAVIHISQRNSLFVQKISPMKWEQFQNVCVPSEGDLSVSSIEKCLALQGTTVHWQGIVKKIEIHSVSNLPLSAISYLPSVFQSKLRCALGTPPSVCDSESFENELDYQHCLIFQVAKGYECSMENWNRFVFYITISMNNAFWKFSTHTNVILNAGNEFKQFVFSMVNQDKVSFVGVLDQGLGTSQPLILLQNIECSECANGRKPASKSAPDFNKMFNLSSLISLFNCIFSPTLALVY